MSRLARTPPFPTIWLVGLFQEISFFLLVNLPGRLYELGLDESGIGVAYSSTALAALILRPWFGRLLDVVHRRTILRVAGVLNFAAVVVLAQVDAAGPLLWSAFGIQRICQVFLFTTALTYAADALPLALRTRGLAVFGLSGLIPIAVSNLIGDAVIEIAGFTGVFLAAATSSVIAWILVWRLPLLPVLGNRPRRSFWAVARQRDMLPLWWITLMFSMGMESLLTFMRTFVDTRQVGSLGIFFLVYGGVAVAIRMGGGRIYETLPHRLVVVVGVMMQAAGLNLLAVANSLVVLLAAGFLMGLAHGAVFPILSSAVVSRARTAERGSAVAMFTSLFDVALLLVGPAVGTLIAWAGYGTAFSTLGVALGFGAAVYAVWDRRLVAVTP